MQDIYRNLLSPKKSQIYINLVVFSFESMTNIWIALSIIALPTILVYEHCFQLLASLDIYIRAFKYKKKQFLAEYQILEFFTESIRIIIE